MINKNLHEIIPPDHQPHRLIALAAQQKPSNINLSILALKEKIDQNRVEEISFIEWIWSIDNDQVWEILPALDRKQLSLKIWHISLNNEWLYFTLVRRLAWFFNGQKNVIISDLVNSFYTWSNSISVQNNLVIKILVALGTDQTKRELVKITCEQNLTRNELLKKINNVLPNIPIFKDYVLEISPYFTKVLHPITLDKVNWLLRCFDEMEETNQITSVEYILNHLSTSIVGNFPELVNWLKNNYTNSSKQSKLSSQARQKLRTWIGAVNYQDFSNLVDLIIDKISLSTTEQKQLKNRQSFWSNYTNSFVRLKILLPSRSCDIINNDIRLDQDIQILEDDGSDETEICIFDLGKNGFIVEFFRGKGSETRLFPQNDYIESVLFSSQPLSVKKIRKLGSEKHDHAYFWQWSCEKLLRVKYNIIPNEGTREFIVISIKYTSPSSATSNKPILIRDKTRHYEQTKLRYNFQYGLPEPSENQLERRKRDQRRWLNEIERLELEAKQSSL
jgi:hypothetical protein